MSSSPHNEELAQKAFSLQSAVFDDLYSTNTIIQYKRERVRRHVLPFLSFNSHILELNSGTGEDAIWFAQQGHTVHATDISAGMQDVLKNKINSLGLQQQISTECISFTNLNELTKKEEYDMIFSNFAGLNCTGELNKVLGSFFPLLKNGGTVTLVLLPKFCLWEFLLVFKGRFKTAMRRLFSKKGVTAHIEGTYFTCWYYDPSYIIDHLRGLFEVMSLEGLCTLVPPSYMEGFAEKHPKTFSFLKSKEERWKTKWPWKSIGDYYIITLKKK